jgi:hypothetical protein
VVVTGSGARSPRWESVWRRPGRPSSRDSGGPRCRHFEITEDYPCPDRVRGEGLRSISGVLDAEGDSPVRPLRPVRAGCRGRSHAACGAGRRSGRGRPEPIRRHLRERDRGNRHLRGTEQASSRAGPRRVSPFFVPMFIPDIAPGLISIRYGAKGSQLHDGVCLRFVRACHWRRVAQHSKGRVDVMIAGGRRQPSRLSRGRIRRDEGDVHENDDPEGPVGPSMPPGTASSWVKGAASLILEARERSPKPEGPASWRDWSDTGCRPMRTTSPLPLRGGRGTVGMRIALEDADVTPEEVDYINAHGTSTPQNDQTETAGHPIGDR